jgi:multiple sugar transport system substrate-binding protein
MGLNQMTFKRFGAVLMTILLSISLLSCNKISETKQSAQEAAPQENPMLSFRITWKDYSGRGQAIQKIVDSYNQSNSDQTDIQLISGDEDMAAIQALLETDLETIFVLPYRYIQYFGSMGLLTDLTDDFTQESSLFYQTVWELGMVKDSIYGIPWLGHSMCLLYNKNLLQQAGVSPESIVDLDSFVSAMDSIEQKTSAKGIGLVGADSNDVSWMVNQFVYGFGGRLVDSTGKKVLINSAESAAAIDFYKNVLGAHAQSSWLNDTGTEVMEHFLNQEVAFEIQGIWGLTDVQKNGSAFEVGVIPLKQIGICSEIGPMMLAIPQNMRDDAKQQAQEFIRYMISIDAQQAILNGEYSPEHDAYYPFRTPIRKDMANTPLMQMNPIYQVFIEGFDNPSVDVPVPAWQTVKKQFYEPGLHSVMLGAITTESFLKMIETEGNKLLTGN